MRAVYDGEMGVNQASREYGIPTTTLRDRISERVTHGTPMGARSYLNQHEDETLEDFLLTASSIGFGKTRAHVMMYAEMVAKEKNLLRKHHITGRWFDGFCKRHPDLSLRKGDSMDVVRFRCTNSEAIQNYYKLLKEHLQSTTFQESLGEYTMSMKQACLLTQESLEWSLNLAPRRSGSWEVVISTKSLLLLVQVPLAMLYHLWSYLKVKT